MTRGAHTWNAVDGTVRIFLAEALLLPTGLVTTGFLTRMLGPAGYGRFALAATLVVWVEWTTSSLFARATLKLVADSDDWRPTASAVIWVSGLTALVVAALVALLATPIAVVLHQPAVASELRLFALDVPMFVLAQTHRNILVGIGEFRQRAVVSAWRWVVKMLLVVALVALGLSVNGAILGSIGASVVELAVARWYVHPPLRRPTDYPLRGLRDYALPLFLATLAVRLLDKMDLFLLTSLGGTASQAGEYGAAQNLSIVPGLLAIALGGLLLSTLSHAHRTGDAPRVRSLARNAIRLVILLAPFAAMTAGAARGIAVAIFGVRFADAGAILALLISAALAMLLLAVTTAIMTAAGRPMLVLATSAPLVPIAIAGHLLLIPRYGAIGAASVTTAVALLGCGTTLVVVHRLWRVAPPASTVACSAVVSAGAYVAARAANVSGAMVALPIIAISAGIVIAYVLLGELTRDELARAGFRLRGDAAPSVSGGV